MTQVSKSSQLIEHRWAFLVGIDIYEEPNFNTLKFCVNDVSALETLLKQLSYTVVALYDQHPQLHRQPTQRNVKAELKQVCQQIGENDLLFVHFACHGTLVGGQPILIMKDSRKSLLNKPEDRLSVLQVEQMMRKSKASRLVLSLDACHTGVEMGRDADDPEFIRNVHDLAEGFVVMAGSTAQQKAQEWQSVQHGVYTYYLLKALSGEAARAGNLFVSVDDVAKYVLNWLKRWQVENSGLIQEPTVKIEGMGDMILADWRDCSAPTFAVPNPNIHLHTSVSMRNSPQVPTAIQGGRSYPFFKVELVFGALLIAVAFLAVKLGSMPNTDTSSPTTSSPATPSPTTPSPTTPSGIEDLFQDGELQYSFGNYEKAEQQFTSAIKKNSNDITLLIWRGLTYIELKKCDKAIQDFEQAIKTNPNKGAAYAFLGFLQAYYLNNLPRAEQNFYIAINKLKDSKARGEINDWREAISRQTDANNLPQICPSGAFPHQELRRLSLMETVH